MQQEEAYRPYEVLFKVSQAGGVGPDVRPCLFVVLCWCTYLVISISSWSGSGCQGPFIGSSTRMASSPIHSGEELYLKT